MTQRPHRSAPLATAALLALISLGAGCGSDGIVLVSVDSSSSLVVDSLAVRVTQGGAGSDVSVPAPGGTPGGTIDLATTPLQFSLQFAKERSGPVHLDVRALRGGSEVARGTGDGVLSAGQITELRVRLGGGVSADLGAVDMANDLARPDLSMNDLVMVADLSRDLAMPDFAQPDLAMPDLAMPDFAMPDLAMPDLTMPDLATPDLRMPDLVMPDFAMPDLVMPDFALPDLVTPDLVVVDLVRPPDLVPPPVEQIDVLGQGLLTDDVVVNNGVNMAIDPQQVAMDRSNNALMTNSVSMAGGGKAALPDNGLFPADGNHPDVQLAFRNNDNGNNARIMQSPGSFAFTTPPRMYKAVQLFCISTEGASGITVTLNYQGGSTVQSQWTVPDWSANAAAPGPGVFLIASGLDRYDLISKQPWKLTEFRLAGLNIMADPAKTLTSVTVTKTGADSGTNLFVFFGAVAIAQ